MLSALVGLAVAGAACSGREEPRPILVEGSTVTVQNLTPDGWRGVEVWLNYQYRVTKPSMPAGERFGIPLNAFVAGFGQRFDPRRQVVQTIQVIAKTKSGAAVDLMYGSGARH